MRRAGKNNLVERGSRRYNRTPVATYRRVETSGRSPFQSRPPKRDRRKFLFGAADTLLIILLAGVLVYSLLVSGRPAVIASDQSYRSNVQYERLIKPDLTGLNDKTKITFDEADAVRKIENQFPEVSVASIELPFFSGQPKVRLLISPPAFKLKSSGQVFVVDQQGKIVTSWAAQSQYKDLLIIDDQSGFKANVGQPVLSSQAAGFIDTIIKQSRRAKVPVSAMSLPPIPLEFDLRTSDQPYFVKFYLNGDANTEAGQFLAARHKFQQSHITPSQYLDVRVAGKIFYK